jgi:hypothetical protein
LRIFFFQGIILKDVFGLRGSGTQMKTDNFDKQASNHLSFYEGFLSLSKVIIAGVIVILALMAIFLL